jgi:hypothetical protein
MEFNSGLKGLSCSYVWRMYNWRMLVLLWQCGWQSCISESWNPTGRHLCTMVQSTGWVASKDIITTRLKDGVQVGAPIKTGADGDRATPAKGLMLLVPMCSIIIIKYIHSSNTSTIFYKVSTGYTFRSSWAIIRPYIWRGSFDFSAFWDPKLLQRCY